MRKVVYSFFIFGSFNLLAITGHELFPEPGLYFVYGKIEKTEESKAHFTYLPNSTGHSEVDLIDNSSLLPFKGKISIKACIKIKKSCSWNCEGSLERIVERVHPATIPQTTEAIQRVSSCAN